MNTVRKTKIMCTLGPASETVGVMSEMKKAGMDVARLNFSHGTHEGHKKLINNVREVNKNAEFPVTILQDLQGSEIRIGEVGKGLDVKEGEKVVLTSGRSGPGRVPISYKDLHKDVKGGSKILIDDAMIELRVVGKDGEDVVCEAVNSGTIHTKKSVNLPGTELTMPALTEKDIKDVGFGVENGVDYIALSFVKGSGDVKELRKIIGGRDIQVISKIECVQAIDDFDNVLAVSDGIMIARGCMGAEIPLEKIPIVQYDIIKKCNSVGKPVITATHMLNSMIEKPRPTRAEVTDVANAILSGSDAIMLSGETTSGKYPVESVRMMDTIAREIEAKIKPKFGRREPKDVSEIVSRAVAGVADSLKAKAIMTLTETGNTARSLCIHRVQTPVYTITSDESVFKRQSLLWGNHVYLVKKSGNLESRISDGIEMLKRGRRVSPGDRVVLTAGAFERGDFLAEVRRVE